MSMPQNHINITRILAYLRNQHVLKLYTFVAYSNLCNLIFVCTL